MASGLTGNEVPGNWLWVRVPCPPLDVSLYCETTYRNSSVNIRQRGGMSVAVSRTSAQQRLALRGRAGNELT